MTDMVEKVAEAIAKGSPGYEPEITGPWEEWPDHWKDEARCDARAAIRALMEPDEKMRQSIEPALDRAYNGTKDCSVEASGVQVFKAMLKAALDD